MTPIPAHRSMSLAEFNKQTDGVIINDWLDSKGLDFNSLIMYAEEADEDGDTMLGVINARLGSDNYPLNAQKLIKTIGKSLTKEWTISLGTTAYAYTVQFDKYETFVQTGFDPRKKWYGNDPVPTSTLVESFMLPKIYTLVLFSKRMTHLHVNKMFYCEKIELFDYEWSGAFDGIWLNLKGSGNDTFLGDGEFFYVEDILGTNIAKVQICADDFLSQFDSKNSAAHYFGYTIYLLLYLELVCIFA